MDLGSTTLGNGSEPKRGSVGSTKYHDLLGKDPTLSRFGSDPPPRVVLTASNIGM